MNNPFVFTLVILMVFVAGSMGVCCKRRPDFLCCGNGKCNIFCCNCDGGCNNHCEATSCDTKQWIKCAASCAACAAACVATRSRGCVKCLGPVYKKCVKCYSSSELVRRKAIEDTKYMIDAFYKTNLNNDALRVMANLAETDPAGVNEKRIIDKFVRNGN